MTSESDGVLTTAPQRTPNRCDHKGHAVHRAGASAAESPVDRFAAGSLLPGPTEMSSSPGSHAVVGTAR